MKTRYRQQTVSHTHTACLSVKGKQPALPRKGLGLKRFDTAVAQINSEQNDLSLCCVVERGRGSDNHDDYPAMEHQADAVRMQRRHVHLTRLAENCQLFYI
jgi:hypothetical protein